MNAQTFKPELLPMKRLMKDLNKPVILSSGRIIFRGKIFGAQEMKEIREWLKQLTFRDIEEPEQIDEETDINCLLTAYREIGNDIEELFNVIAQYA